MTIELQGPRLVRLDGTNKDQYFAFWLETYQHPLVNACSEEDTDDLFYSDQMSKIKELVEILVLAGFKRVAFVHPNMSRHKQWNLYCVMRYVAYPQDYTAEQIIGKINGTPTVAYELKTLLLGRNYQEK